METWVLFIMLVGVPTVGDPAFTTRAACELYRHIAYEGPVAGGGATVASMFRIECVRVS